MTLTQLYYFQTLAKYEHYTKAAEELHIAQPTLSKAIKNLEKELGILLFEPYGRNVILTKPGKRYLQTVNLVLRELEIGNAKLRLEQEMVEAYLDIGGVSALQDDVIPELIFKFQKQHNGKIFFSSTTAISSDLLEGLKDDKYDLVFSGKKASETYIESIPVYEQKFFFVAPKDHPFRGREQITLEEIQEEPIIAFTSRTGIWQTILKLFIDHDCRPRIVAEANESRNVIGMVRAGCGCGIIADSMRIFSDDITAIPIAGLDVHQFLYLCYRKDKPLSPIGKEFVEFTLSRLPRK